MKNLTLTDSFEPETLLVSDNTQEGTEALQLHFEIKASFAAAATAMVEFSRQLKIMRDKKLYEHIGFETFEEYVEKAHGIKQRQAYTYIQTYEKLKPKLMGDNAGLGITKLALLCGICAVERDDFIENNDLEGLSVEEFKALVEKNKGLSEQVSLLLTDNDNKISRQESMDKEIEKLKSELKEKDNKIQDLCASQEPIDVAAIETEKIAAAVEKREKELMAQFKKDKAQAIKDSELAAQNSGKEKIDKAIEKAKLEARAQTEKDLRAEFEKEQAVLNESVTAAQKQAEKLEKELKIAGNKKTVKFSLIFEQLQKNLIDCLEIIEEIKKEDVKTADKLHNALKSVVGQLVGG